MENDSGEHYSIVVKLVSCKHEIKKTLKFSMEFKISSHPKEGRHSNVPLSVSSAFCGRPGFPPFFSSLVFWKQVAYGHRKSLVDCSLIIVNVQRAQLYHKCCRCGHWVFVETAEAMREQVSTLAFWERWYHLQVRGTSIFIFFYILNTFSLGLVEQMEQLSLFLEELLLQAFLF